MILRLTLLVPCLLAALIYGANADPNAGSLYPPGLMPLIQRADVLLSAGQYNDAVKIYSEAIEQSPVDYLLYYKRATAYYSLSRHPAALSDFDKVLEFTSGSFDKAYLMKARILAKEGRFTEARDAIKRYTSNVKDQDAQEVLYSISEGELAAKKVSQTMRAKLWTACEEAALTALKTASHSAELRQQRADCAIAAGNIESAVGDLTRLTHLITPSTALLMKIFRLSYFLGPYNLGEQSTALNTLKQCLHYDPDSSECLPAHRLVKSLDKSFKALEKHLAAEDWRAIVKLLASPAEGGKDGVLSSFDVALEAHTKRGALGLPAVVPTPSAKRTSPRRAVLLRDPKKGERWCEALLGMEGMQDDADGLLGRGEALLAKEEWEEAVRVLERAFEASGRSSREIHQKLQKAQRLLKQSKQKDYYKVLDVPRDADTATIKKAYRNAARKAHPDKGGSEAKMAAVNEAYEVLNNPELRQRFDNGDDPNDPMAGQGGSPFSGGAGGAQHFQQFFQQGGFQFHYSPPGFH
ncbi:hypothetical protein POSPLADRAFT_1070782 [Postia placenta MAD-698-R-SB12]|uniref:J domain-containing protein n=1 Tax=Postia placenta MAD-698-R-SB12 TaxID=670580 RepID=A0A1X6MWC4_9APHY|nr:hypothetical protein POSPLADRAFT_1070782 [Postia placenta MAD-698-R-SB12]OSX60668.1 hypothetical protein POSPLADRAFT_1070782 [Postia placenta MAD-698-R-SB12]